MTDTIPTRLGATMLADGRTCFVVWAPTARAVEVSLAANRPVRRALEPDGEYWTTVVDGLQHGDRYRFVVDGDELADPASRWQPDGVHGPSAVVDGSVFRWHDDDWHGVELTDTVL